MIRNILIPRIFQLYNEDWIDETELDKIARKLFRLNTRCCEEIVQKFHLEKRQFIYVPA